MQNKAINPTTRRCKETTTEYGNFSIFFRRWAVHATKDKKNHTTHRKGEDGQILSCKDTSMPYIIHHIFGIIRYIERANQKIAKKSHKKYNPPYSFTKITTLIRCAVFYK